MDDRIETGCCFCGAISAQAEGEPFWIAYDHDDDCRKALGSPLTIWIGYRRPQFKLLKGIPKTFSKTKGVTRAFCADCGTAISYLDDGLPEDIYLAIGFMDRPECFEPQVHAYWKHRLPWIDVADRLPSVDAYSRERTASSGYPNKR